VIGALLGLLATRLSASIAMHVAGVFAIRRIEIGTRGNAAQVERSDRCGPSNGECIRDDESLVEHMRTGCSIDAMRSSVNTVLAQYLKLARGRRVDDAATGYVRAVLDVVLAANALSDSRLHRAFETFVMSRRAST
jgi:hypothetical protein